MSSKMPKTLTGMMARAVGMKTYVPKTGRAAAMRAWMQGQKTPWTALDLCIGMGLPPGDERDRVRVEMRIFVKRGEAVIVRKALKRGRQQYYYTCNTKFRLHARGCDLKARIYKAMYIAGEFALSDIQRLAEAPGRNYLDKLLRPLRAAGYVQAVGRRVCARGSGAETIYHIANRDRFRLEVMR